MILFVTCADGTRILRAAHARVFPKEIGERKFSEGMRTGIAERIRQLYRALRKLSPLMTEDMQLYFGPKEYYEEKEPRINRLTNAEIPWKPEEDYLRVKKEFRKKMVDVELPGRARKGLFWSLYLLTHPDSPACLGPGLQEEVAWPLAVQLKCVKQLEEEIGLDKAEVPEITWDDEREAEEEKEESEDAQTSNAEAS